MGSDPRQDPEESSRSPSRERHAADRTFKLLVPSLNSTFFFFSLPELFKHLRLTSTNGVSHQIKRSEGFNRTSKTLQPPPFTSCPQRELVRAEHER